MYTKIELQICGIASVALRCVALCEKLWQPTVKNCCKQFSVNAFSLHSATVRYQKQGRLLVNGLLSARLRPETGLAHQLVLGPEAPSISHWSIGVWLFKCDSMASMSANEVASGVCFTYVCVCVQCINMPHATCTCS